MTLDLTAIRELAVRAKEMAEKATPRPWSSEWYGPISEDGYDLESSFGAFGPIHAVNDEGDTEDAENKAIADAAFIASSRTVVPELADAVLGLCAAWEQQAVELTAHQIATEAMRQERDALKAENERLQADYDEANDGLHRAREVINAKSEDVVNDIKRLLEERDAFKAENVKLKSEIEGLIRAQV